MTALAVFRAAAAVVTHRVHKLNNEANKTVLAGKECHDSLLIQQDRAAYLADHLQLAVADVSKAVVLLREYASECGECGGTGLVTLFGAYYGGDADDQPCTECADIHATLARLEARP